MNDTAPNDETGTIVALLERMRTQRLPRVLDIKAKLDAGQRLDDFDLAFLGEIATDCENVKPLWDRHPELQHLASRMMHLYHGISERALANEQAGSNGSVA